METVFFFFFSGSCAQDIIRTKCNLQVLIPEPDSLTQSEVLWPSECSVQESHYCKACDDARDERKMSIKLSQINNPHCGWSIVCPFSATTQGWGQCNFSQHTFVFIFELSQIGLIEGEGKKSNISDPALAFS